MPMSADSWRPSMSDPAESRCHRVATKIKSPTASWRSGL
jgi:hypothetical protein